MSDFRKMINCGGLLWLYRSCAVRNASPRQPSRLARETWKVPQVACLRLRATPLAT